MRYADGHKPPNEYFQHLVYAYQWLDISGIDSDRAFKLPLNQIYVRLRVISSNGDETDSAEEDSAISIQTALERHQRTGYCWRPGKRKINFPALHRSHLSPNASCQVIRFPRSRSCPWMHLFRYPCFCHAGILLST